MAYKFWKSFVYFVKKEGLGDSTSSALRDLIFFLVVLIPKRNWQKRLTLNYKNNHKTRRKMFTTLRHWNILQQDSPSGYNYCLWTCLIQTTIICLEVLSLILSVIYWPCVYLFICQTFCKFRQWHPQKEKIMNQGWTLWIIF